MALVNNMPYPNGMDFTVQTLDQAPPYGNEYLNSSNEHVHNLFASAYINVTDATGQNGQNLWQSDSSLQLTGGYELGKFHDLSSFDIKKWGKFLNTNFASYL